MAELPFVDSFAHYNATQSAGKWTTMNNAASSINNTGGRSGINGCFAGNQGNDFSLTLLGSYNQIYVGFAYNTQAWTNHPVEIHSGVSGDPQAFIIPNSDGTFILQIGQSFGANATNSANFGLNGRPQSLGVWYYFEVGLTVNNTTMTGTCKVNGHIEANNIVVLNNYVGHTNFTNVRFVCPGGTGVVGKFCDIYINNNNFWGDVIIGLLKPAGVGNITQWTATNSIPNWQIVAGVPPGNNANLVSAGANNLIDCYVMQQVPTNATILAVQALTYAQKDSGNAASFEQVYRANNNNIQVGTVFNPSANQYLFFRDAYYNSVFTNNNWTVPEVNSMQFGQERVT